jgi:hypothetical protein
MKTQSPQDVQSRVPYIANTVEELGWTPKIDMNVAVRWVLESYQANLAAASDLVDVY